MAEVKQALSHKSIQVVRKCKKKYVNIYTYILDQIIVIWIDAKPGSQWHHLHATQNTQCLYQMK